MLRNLLKKRKIPWEQPTRLSTNMNLNSAKFQVHSTHFSDPQQIRILSPPEDPSSGKLSLIIFNRDEERASFYTTIYKNQVRKNQKSPLIISISKKLYVKFELKDNQDTVNIRISELSRVPSIRQANLYFSSFKLSFKDVWWLKKKLISTILNDMCYFHH